MFNGLRLPRRVLAAPVIGAALLVGLTACGSSSPSTTTSAGAASGGTTSSSARYQARLNLAKCLRAHGVNVPDPSPNGGSAGGGGGGAFRTARSSPNFQSAMQACAQYRRQATPGGNLSPAQRAQFQQDLVKFAQCMRSHNINIPDPTTSAGGGFGILRQIPSSERNSPAFRTALQACSTNLPFRPGARRGGGGPPGAGATSGA